jgi:hypothetical protein
VLSITKPSVVRSIRTQVRVLAASLALLTATSMPTTAEIRQNRAMGLFATLSDATLDLELIKGTVSDDGRRVSLVVAARPKGKLSAAPEFWLATVDEKGATRKWRPSVPDLTAVDSSPNKHLAMKRIVIGMSERSPEQLLVAVSQPGLTPILMAFAPGSQGDPTRVPVVMAGVTPELQAVVATSTGRLLAVGNAGPNFLTAEVKPDGTTVSNRVLSIPAVVIEDAGPTPDGGLIVVGRQASARKAPSGAEALPLWMGKFSAKGDVEREAKLDGRSPSITALSNGDFVVSVFQLQGRTQHLEVRLLDRDLRQKWTKTLVTDQPPTAPAFQVAATAAGGFVVAGAKDRGLWVAELSATGDVVWTDAKVPTPPEMEMVFNLELLTSRLSTYVAYTAFAATDREQRQEIRLVRLAR